MSRSLVASLLGFGLVAAVFVKPIATSWAAPPPGAGDLDPSFGAGGTVTTDFSGSSDIGEAVAIQANGRIVVGGQSCSPLPSGTCDFSLARYLSSGVLDASFGTGGKVTTDFGGTYDAGQSLALQADGKIVLAGYTCLGGTVGCPLGS